MGVKTLNKYIQLYKEYFKLELKTAIEYRINFIIQVVSMFLNNVIWMVFWAIIFAKFPVINGWSLNDIILLYAVLSAAFGFKGMFFGGESQISNCVVDGKLDYYLTTPKKSLLHILVSKIDWFDLGDLLFGLVLAFIFLPLYKLPLFFILLIPCILIILSFGIIVGSLSFYIGNSQSLSDSLYGAIIAFSSYPASIYSGIAKFIVFFIIPAGFITTVPVILLKSFDWIWFGLLYAFAVAILLLAIYVFYKGLKKYESGNLIGVRL